jgi:hypothetical protein
MYFTTTRRFKLKKPVKSETCTSTICYPPINQCLLLRPNSTSTRGSGCPRAQQLLTEADTPTARSHHQAILHAANQEGQAIFWDKNKACFARVGQYTKHVAITTIVVRSRQPNGSKEAWKVAFPSLHFPVELIGLFPASKSPIAVAPHQRYGQEPPALTCQPTNDDSSKLKVAINKNLKSKLMKERAFFMSLKKVLSHSSNQPTQHTKHLLAAFAASHPQIAVIYQEMLIALSRYTFLLEIKAVVDCSGKAKGMDLSFFNSRECCKQQPLRDLTYQLGDRSG